jgi:uncharacterized protein (TIGR00290 family)
MRLSAPFHRLALTRAKYSPSLGRRGGGTPVADTTLRMAGVMRAAPETAEHRHWPAGIGSALGTRTRAWVSWSTGKESAYALRVARADRRVEVLGLFTTVHEDAGRVAYNGVPVGLAKAQARALGLPLHVLSVPAGCPARAREVRRRRVLAREAVPEGVSAIIFGDVGGTDIRASRAARLSGFGIDAVFPLWGADTSWLCRDILAAGIRAIITRVDPRVLAARWAGKLFDEVFLQALTDRVDPCGENGEFHTFVLSSPDFDWDVPVGLERVTRRDGSVYALISASR